MLSAIATFQLFVVDLVDIGLMNVSEAEGRHRMDDTMRQFADAVDAGLLVDVESTSGSGPDHVTVTSLRRCDSDVARCRNATVVVGSASRPRPALQHRPRAAVMTSSNGSVTSSSSGAAVTSSTWRTVAGVAELTALLYIVLPRLNRLRFVADNAAS